MSNYPFQSDSVSNHRLLLVTFLILIVAVFFENFSDYANYVIYPIWAFWLVFLLINNKSINQSSITFVRVSFVLLAIVALYKLFGISSVNIRFLLRSINWIMAGVVSVYAMKLFNNRELSAVYIVMIISLFILLYILLIEGRFFLGIGEENDAANIAGAWYGSLFMLLSGVSLIVFLNVRDLFPRFIAVLFFVVTIYLNFFIMQRATNVVVTLAEVFLILIFTIKRKPIIIVLSFITIGFVFIALFSSDFLINFFDWLATISPSERLSIRFNDVSTTLIYQDFEATTGSFSRRYELAMNSWNTFTSSIGNFLFGIGEHENNNIIGNHNFIIDFLAQYGIVGGSFLFIYLKKQYQIFISFCNKKKNWSLYMQFTIVFIVYVFRNFYGSLAFGLSNLLLLVFFPLTMQIVQHYLNKFIKL